MYRIWRIEYSREFEDKPTPIILIPKDIMRDLPIARDWSEACQAAWENDDLRRRRVSEHIGAIWEAKTRADKDLIKSRALAKLLLLGIHDKCSPALSSRTSLFRYGRLLF